MELIETQFAEEIIRIIDKNELTPRQVETTFNSVLETLNDIMVIPKKRSSSRCEHEEQGLKL